MLGSISRMPASSTGSISMPFASLRSRSAPRRPTSASSTATMSLPQRSKGMPCASQKATAAALPSRQKRALRLPGA